MTEGGCMEAKVTQLLADPSRWTHKANARDARGYAITANDPAAKSWCLHGAMHHCYGYGTSKFSAAHARVEQLLDARRYRGGLIAWNDTPGRTYDEVMDLVRRAGV